MYTTQLVTCKYHTDSDDNSQQNGRNANDHCGFDYPLTTAARVVIRYILNDVGKRYVSNIHVVQLHINISVIVAHCCSLLFSVHLENENYIHVTKRYA